MADIQDLVIKLSVDNANLKTKLDETSRHLGGMQTKAASLIGTFKGVGAALGLAFGARELIGSLKEAVNYIDDVGDAASRLRISTQEMSKLGYAAKQADLDFASLSQSIGFMLRTIGQAAGDSNSSQSKLLKSLGLDPKQLNAQDVTTNLGQIFDALNRIDTVANKEAAAQMLLGRSFANVAELAEKGSAGLQAYGDELEKLGGTVTPDMAKAADDAKKALKELTTVWQSLFTEIVNSSAFRAIIKGLQNATANIQGLKSYFGSDKSDEATLKYIDEKYGKEQQKIALERGKSMPEMSVDELRSAYDSTKKTGKLTPNLSSGASGKKAADEAKSMIDSVATAQEKLNEKFRQAKKLLDAKAINPEQYQKITTRLNEDLEEANRKMDTMGNKVKDIGNAFFDDVGNSMVEAFRRGESVGKSMWKSIKEAGIKAIGDLAAEQMRRNLIGLLGGSANSQGQLPGIGDLLVKGAEDLFSGFKLPSFADGGFTGSGGGSGVDGRGGFPAILHPNEMVLNSGQMKGMRGSTTVISPITIQATNQADIDRRIMATVPLIVDASVARSMKLMDNGGDMSRQVSRRL